MCICDSSYPRKLAFSYLDELSKEFQRSYEGKIEGVTRPYAFMGFGPCFLAYAVQAQQADQADTFISKTTRLYKDSRSLTQGAGGSAAPPSQLDQLNENLQDVTRIMTKNMEDLLWRGDSLDRTFQAARRLTGRHVTSVHLVAVRIGKVPQSGAEYQPGAVVAQMGASGRDRIIHDPVHMVAIFLGSRDDW
jgi:hypothetical protein